MPRSLTSLQAIRKLTYNTRRLMPGDTFDARSRDARLLIATRRARVAETQSPAPSAPPVEPPAPPPDPGADELKAARADYEAAVGRKPFHGWDVGTLRTKIAEAQAGDDA